MSETLFLGPQAKKNPRLTDWMTSISTVHFIESHTHTITIAWVTLDLFSLNFVAVLGVRSGQK